MKLFPLLILISCTIFCVSTMAILGCSGFVKVTILNTSSEPINVEIQSAECKITVPAKTKLRTDCEHFTDDVSLKFQSPSQTTWTTKRIRYRDAVKGRMAPSEIFLSLP